MVLVNREPNMVIIKTVGRTPDLNASTESKMMIKIAACLLTLGFLAACETTTTTKRETLRETNARYASNTQDEPAPPAEGPEDALAKGTTMDPVQNPALVPSPLLRQNAVGDP